MEKVPPDPFKIVKSYIWISEDLYAFYMELHIDCTSVILNETRKPMGTVETFGKGSKRHLKVHNIIGMDS